MHKKKSGLSEGRGGHTHLADHTDLCAVPGSVNLSEVSAVHQHHALIRVIEPLQQRHQRGLQAGMDAAATAAMNSATVVLTGAEAAGATSVGLFWQGGR